MVNQMLMILDGFGINEKTWQSAICQAKTPNLDKLLEKYPNTVIRASEESVGLPEGQMGNSEVGHLNIGAGRIVYQDLTRITNQIKSGEFDKNEAITKCLENAVNNNKSLHIMGLVSDGGVHSHIDHILYLIELAAKRNVKRLYLHAFTDGRDVPPRSALPYLKRIADKMKEENLGRIATISGRYYAMDRDKRYERLEKAYDALTLSIGREAEDYEEAISLAYSHDENDEFIIPTIVGEAAMIESGDSVIFANFRPDRAREITHSLVDDDFDGFERKKRVKGLNYVCMTEYEKNIPNVNIAYPPEELNDTLGEYLSKNGYTQLRIAETEKYAHVTFFFNGGVEAPNPMEDRILIPSAKVATYDMKPEMSANEIAEEAIKQIKTKKYNFIILNFANPDMVGHTGNFKATVEAIEVLDGLVKNVVDAILENDGQIMIISDHGNADLMLDDDNMVVTAHSLNPVPMIVIGNEKFKLMEDGVLADVVPTLLDLAGIKKPEAMTGHSLLVR